MATRAALLEEIDRACIRGRGGAGYPLAKKLAAVQRSSGEVIVVANGEEGEPSSVKDRWLLAHRPSLVIDGLSIAAALSGADTGYIYVSDPECEASVVEARTDFARSTTRPDLDLEVVRVQRTYVAGEETAVIRALEGGPALPADKPPRPTESGVHERPTVVSNVETLAQLALLNTLGLEDYASVGTTADAGTLLLTLTTRSEAHLCEVPFGTTLSDVLGAIGLNATNSPGLIVGGYFGGLHTPAILGTPLGYADLAARGAGLGCGAVSLLDAEECPIAVASAIMDFFAEQNAAQCGSCFNGTAAMSQTLRALTNGQATHGDVDILRRWSRELRGRGACGTLDGATTVAATLLHQFDTLIIQHLGSVCGACESTRDDYQPAPFAVSLAPCELAVHL
ncbi:NADH-ubiquinone oxidoreductase-F iron-sulfur binding region domain-containing protein [Nocardia australiensis]|uniref:NADH-ubiquinone oxidoreductase-F iron-sulfur binding region domain-containing protein n=1 Tax=Nocardia australiensis TaxID=2887191 RepID=UPI001D137A7B|nr:NADH-ubiquinone oxidoreductase-F iron-sulfur binding region domain-containing protein [Nocardia australiensis]